jgi:hypothetical protein
MEPSAHSGRPKSSFETALAKKVEQIEMVGKDPGRIKPSVNYRGNPVSASMYRR